MIKDMFFAFGKGVQSNAILFMIDKGVLPAPEIIFHSNMGVTEDYLLPYFTEYSMPVIERICQRFGTKYQESDLDFQSAVEKRVITPFWFAGADGKPALVTRRSCTKTFKVDPSNLLIPKRAWCKVVLGISLDEVRRAREWQELSWGRMRENWYPLIEHGLTRADCIELIVSYGMPVPPKSACDICPFSAKRRLIERLATDSTLYGRIKKIEANWHEKPKHAHKFLTVFLRDLPSQEQAIKLMSVYAKEIDNSGGCNVCEY